jgi:hypothetical protein
MILELIRVYCRYNYAFDCLYPEDGGRKLLRNVHNFTGGQKRHITGLTAQT